MRTLQAKILKRALGDKGFKDLYEQYTNAKLNHRGTTPPSSKQIRLASLTREFGAAEAGKKAGVSPFVANYAMSRVARYEYLTKEK